MPENRDGIPEHLHILMKEWVEESKVISNHMAKVHEQFVNNLKVANGAGIIAVISFLGVLVSKGIDVRYAYVVPL
jgi:hypothetical protein